MTDYNDGKWHGWNGDKMPLHPKSLVNAAWFGGREHPQSDTRRAEGFNWESANGSTLFAFRVVKEYREPREFWVFLGKTYHDAEGAKQAYRNACRQSPHHSGKEIIHVREVLE